MPTHVPFFADMKSAFALKFSILIPVFVGKAFLSAEEKDLLVGSLLDFTIFITEPSLNSYSMQILGYAVSRV